MIFGKTKLELKVGDICFFRFDYFNDFYFIHRRF